MSEPDIKSEEFVQGEQAGEQSKAVKSEEEKELKKKGLKTHGRGSARRSYDLIKAKPIASDIGVKGDWVQTNLNDDIIWVFTQNNKKKVYLNEYDEAIYVKVKNKPSEGSKLQFTKDPISVAPTSKQAIRPTKKRKIDSASTSSSKTSSSSTETRRMLVIGNAGYRCDGFDELPGSKTDAQLMYDALTKMGYEHLQLEGRGGNGPHLDCDTKTMNNLILNFNSTLLQHTGPIKAIFYFSGHGGTDQELRTDASNNDQQGGSLLYSIDGKGVEVETMISYFATRASASNDHLGIILDSCRVPSTKPSGLSGGRVAELRPKGNVFVMYPCAPNSRAGVGNGKHAGSPFTQALAPLLNIKEDVITIFRRAAYAVTVSSKGSQEPWYEESMKSADGTSITF